MKHPHGAGTPSPSLRGPPSTALPAVRGLGSHRGHSSRVPVWQGGDSSWCHLSPRSFSALEEPGHRGEALRSCKVSPVLPLSSLGAQTDEAAGEAPPAGETRGWTSHSLGFCPLSLKMGTITVTPQGRSEAWRRDREPVRAGSIRGLRLPVRLGPPEDKGACRSPGSLHSITHGGLA